MGTCADIRLRVANAHYDVVITAQGSPLNLLNDVIYDNLVRKVLNSGTCYF